MGGFSCLACDVVGVPLGVHVVGAQLLVRFMGLDQAGCLGPHIHQVAAGGVAKGQGQEHCAV